MRKLSQEESALITFMLKDNPTYKSVVESLPTSIVQEMDDGGMGSLRFVYEDGIVRSFGNEIASVSISDSDDVPVSFSLNVDETGALFELDIFKGDFSPLKQFPITPYNILPPPQIL